MVFGNYIYSGESYWLKIMKIFLDAMNHEERANTVREIKNHFYNGFKKIFFG
jgi:hypothetical protein